MVVVDALILYGALQSVDVIKYTDEEYEKHLTDPVCTKNWVFSNFLSFFSTHNYALQLELEFFLRLYIDHLRFWYGSDNLSNNIIHSFLLVQCYWN